MEYKNIKLNKIIHASFHLQYKDLNIYIDPFSHDSEIDYSSYPKADYIFVTHEHFDHFDKVAIEALRSEDTIIYGNEIVNQEGRELGIKLIKPNHDYKNIDFKFRTTKAYNMNKFRSPGIPYHPKDNDGVGYILDLEGTIIYHMGDTDPIDEHAEIKDIDILLVPVSGTYVMNPAEASNVANLMNTQISIPMHYGAIVGSEEDALNFKKLTNTKVEIL